MTTNEPVMDYMEELNQYRLLRKAREMRAVKAEETETGEILSDEEDSPEDNDNSSDEDFSLKMKRKKRKLRKVKTVEPEKKKKRVPKQKNIIPSFDRVMEVQIKHASKFINSDDYESESDDIEVEPVEAPVEEKSREPTPPPRKVVHKRRKITIHPWCPIGITGGRLMNNMWWE